MPRAACRRVLPHSTEVHSVLRPAGASDELAAMRAQLEEEVRIRLVYDCKPCIKPPLGGSGYSSAPDMTLRACVSAEWPAIALFFNRDREVKCR